LPCDSAWWATAHQDSLKFKYAADIVRAVC